MRMNNNPHTGCSNGAKTADTRSKSTERYRAGPGLQRLLLRIAIQILPCRLRPDSQLSAATTVRRTMAKFDSSGVCVGVVALQGAFVEHCKMLAKLNVKSREIRNIEDLEGINALILPGGESTAMAKVSAGNNNIFAEISKLVKNKMPVWGTCAGLILLANKVEGQKTGGQGLIGGLDIVASRNFFGAQVKSFEALLRPPPPRSKRPRKRKRTVDGTKENLVQDESHIEKENLFNGIFIRAPAILKANADVEILNSLIVNNCTERKREVIVAVKQENILATAFHPELTSDCRWHQYFYEEIVLKKLREDL